MIINIGGLYINGDIGWVALQDWRDKGRGKNWFPGQGSHEIYGSKDHLQPLVRFAHEITVARKHDSGGQTSAKVNTESTF